jgi:hypothetical protein
MRYTIQLRRDWDTVSRSYPRGTYQVPKEMPEKLAKRALATGLATKVLPKREQKRADSSAQMGS